MNPVMIRHYAGVVAINCRGGSCDELILGFCSPWASAQSLLVATINSVLTVCDVIQMCVVPRSAGVVYEGAHMAMYRLHSLLVLALSLHTGE